MSIIVLENGLLDTVQDMGRYGFAQLGINHNGAMDTVAARTANYLAGNDANTPVIECHFHAATLLFNTAALIAITGADFGPAVNNTPVPLNTPLHIPAGAILKWEQLKGKYGARAYLAIHGGLKLDPWLNSYATNLKAKAGGYKGKALQKGDELFFNRLFEHTSDDLHILPWHADTGFIYAATDEIRIIAGNEYSVLNDCAQTILEGNSFTVSSQSDRMGYRLAGSPLQTMPDIPSMISAGVTRGTIQLLPSGQLIILMSDHQTTGGYPRIAHVISADLPKLAQVRINTPIRFVIISPAEAEALLLQQEHHLQQLKNACEHKWGLFKHLLPLQGK